MRLWLIRFSSSRHRDRWSWTWIFAVCWLGSFHQFILCWLSEPDSWWLQSKQRSSTSSSSGLRHDLSGMSWNLFSIEYAWNASPGTIPGDIGVRWSNLLHWLCLMWMRKGYQMTALAAPPKKANFHSLYAFCHCLQFMAVGEDRNIDEPVNRLCHLQARFCLLHSHECYSQSTLSSLWDLRGLHFYFLFFFLMQNPNRICTFCDFKKMEMKTALVI